MERSGQNGILERILSAREPAVVLLAPAASGKTTAALDFYLSFRQDARTKCLLLAPNAAAAAHFRRILLARSPSGVLLEPQVLTFAALAGRILSAAGVKAWPLSAFRRHVLLTGIVDELNADGKLPALARVADTPGLVTALDEAIAELKRAAVEPKALAKALRKTDKKGCDLLAVYERFQQQLHAEGAYDVEGRMWQARDALAAGESAPGLQGIEAVAADGFTDFTPTQLEILSLLAKRGKRILITLPYSRDGRARLWHWTGRTLGNIRRAFAGKPHEIYLDAGAECPPPAPAGGLRRLWDRVFDFDAASCELPAGLNAIAAPTVEAEVAAVARRIKKLLLEGAGCRMAVLARSLDGYREPIERIFAEHDIPVSHAPARLCDAPVVRFVLNVASLQPALAFRDVLGVITSSYFRPQALGGFDAQTVAAAEMLIREGNVLAGREAYARAAERLCRQPRQTAEDEEDRPAVALGPFNFPPAAISKAAEMLERLFDLAAGAGRKGAAEKIGAIVDALALYDLCAECDDSSIAARDLRALAAMQDAMAELGDREMPPGRLREALAAAQCPPQRTESLVDVTDVLDARSLRYEHVFLLGMGEGQFPHRPPERPLIGEAERARWAERGVALDNRNDLMAREMLLFYLACSRSGANLTVSYVETDTSGRPAAASCFLESLLAPAGGLEGAAAKITEKLQPGRFTPPAGCLYSRRDALNVAAAGMFDAGDGDWPSALAWVIAEDESAVERLSAGLWALSRRTTRGPCDSFDGRIAAPPLLDALRDRFGPRAVFSATQLNAYGICPWQFFATYVLRLAALREPARRLEPVAKGIFCHDVLFRVMLKLCKGHGGTVKLPETDEAELAETLEAAVAESSAAIEARRPPYPALWDLQRRRMHAELRDYLLASRQRSELQPESIHFELGFAEAETDEPARQSRDPASRSEPVAVATDEGQVLLRGKIDRVDRLSFAGREGLFVIDYKTGRTPTKADITEGRNLQLPLYSLAAQKLLGEEALGGAFHKIGEPEGKYEKLFACFASRAGKYSADKEYEQKFQAAVANVGRFVAGIRGGRFDLAPTHDCPRYCAFGQICQFSEWRAELKAPPGREGENER